MSLWSLTALCAASIACGTYAPVGTPQPPLDLAGFMAALRQAGATVALGGTIEQPFFTRKAQLVSVDGEDVQVFQYRSESAARADAETVSPDGGKIGTTAPFWVAPPHFYRKGLLIVLYVGQSEAVQARLQAVLGPPFAGGARGAAP